MATRRHSIAFVPFTTGLALWLAGTALLMEDSWRAGHWDVQHLAVPILTAATCVAGCLAHMRLARLRLLSGLALAALALFGSGLCVLNTLSRTATDRDRTIAVAMAANRVLHDRQGELDRARVEMTRECKARGPRCREWEQRVDNLTRETAPMLALAVDPRADAVARLAMLAGLDGERTKQIVKAIEPAALPVFLELGAIVLLGISFPARKAATAKQPLPVADNTDETLKGCARVWSREEALQDMLRLKEVGAQRFLAARYGVDKSTISRWMSQWETEGHVQRTRDGQSKAVAMLAAPARTRNTLVFRHKPRRLPAS